MSKDMGGFDFSNLPPDKPAMVEQWGHRRLDLPEIDSGDYLPDGPALLYVHDHSAEPATRTLTRVDHSAPFATGPGNSGRERAICRALLLHALRLLDEAEGS